MHSILSSRLLVLLSGFVFVLTACSGPRETTTDEPEPPPATPQAQAEEPDREPPPEEPPKEKEEPRTPVPVRVQGYRIQILMTDDQDAANAEVNDASAWWRSLSSSDRPAALGTSDLSVDVKWKQPYYRVRVGDFASRDDAERALSLVKQQYPKAFIVPDVVTVMR